jgi:hypothetical protein
MPQYRKLEKGFELEVMVVSLAYSREIKDVKLLTLTILLWSLPAGCSGSGFGACLLATGLIRLFHGWEDKMFFFLLTLPSMVTMDERRKHLSTASTGVTGNGGSGQSLSPHFRKVFVSGVWLERPA